MRGKFPARNIYHQSSIIDYQPSAIMSKLLSIPTELLDEIVSDLDPLATFHLLLTCRCMSSRVLPAIHLHAMAPKKGLPALHWAAVCGHLPLVKYLLTIFPVDLLDEHGNTPLHAVAMPWYLLGADSNCTGEDAVTPLALASSGGNANPNSAEDIVQIPVAHDAVIHSRASTVSRENEIRNHPARMARFLLDAGASPNTKNLHTHPVIVTAAWDAETGGILEALLDYGADVNVTTYIGSTALMVAAENCLLDSVKLLVGRGANVNVVDTFHRSVLTYAAKSEDPHIVEYLVGRDDFDIHPKAHVYLLALYGFHTALKILLQRGASLTRTDDQSQLLVDAEFLHNADIAVSRWLSQRAWTAGRIPFLTPLMVAIHWDDLPIVIVLLEYWTVETDTIEETFRTLMLACWREAEEIVGLLLEKGVDINMVDADGLTVMSHAKRAGWDTVVAMMASYGGR